MKAIIPFIGISVLLILLTSRNGVASAQAPEIEKNARCPVCGMFVIKYPYWITQLIFSDGDVKVFDGVKDMMAYYFAPESYGKTSNATIVSVFVKDYYQQEWIDGKTAFYVSGSDVYGPMGHELIPFNSRAAAESFMKDHKGEELVSFSEITDDLITALRMGHQMKGQEKK